MSKVITFSRYFPSYHSKKGEHTFFVEKILNGIKPKQENGLVDIHLLPEPVQEIINDFQMLCEPTDIKYHTIRSGKRWKVGDKFSPRVWSGKPYASKQITIADDIEVKKIWNFEMKPALWFDECEYFIDGVLCNGNILEVAKNDGLDIIDFAVWFEGKKAASSKRKPFFGQIICWNENINY